MSAAPTIAVQAPVVEVVLFEDRAQILRRGNTQLQAGRHRLELEGVAPVLSDRSLRVEIQAEPSAAAQLMDFRVRRERITTPAQLPSDLEALHAEDRHRTAALQALAERRARRAQEREQLSAAASQLLAEAVEDSGWNRPAPGRWQAELEQLWTRQAELDAEILDLLQGHEDAERELNLLRQRIQGQAGPSTRLRCWLELDLELEQLGSVQLELSYLVPGACWRPRYRATLHTQPSPSLAMEHQASVWQRTGEDWTDVQLRFSTQRPSLGTEPPLLGEDLLHIQPRQERVVVELREQHANTTGLGQRPQQAQELPGVDDGGQAIDLRAAHPATVPSDGRPYRVSIGASEAPAKVERVVMAELTNAALLRCTTTNSSPNPLLAGPVDLLADSGRVGRGKVAFIAPRESVALGFGPDPNIRVFRRHDVVEREAGALSRWDSSDHRVEVLVSNLGAEHRTLQILERVPVSELDQIQIDLKPDDSTGPLSPDADGLISWQLELAPGATDQVELAYTIRKRGGVVERG